MVVVGVGSGCGFGIGRGWCRRCRIIVLSFVLPFSPVLPALLKLRVGSYRKRESQCPVGCRCRDGGGGWWLAGGGATTKKKKDGPRELQDARSL